LHDATTVFPKMKSQACPVRKERFGDQSTENADELRFSATGERLQ
jgi:hypothetical protein